MHFFTFRAMKQHAQSFQNSTKIFYSQNVLVNIQSYCLNIFSNFFEIPWNMDYGKILKIYLLSVEESLFPLPNSNVFKVSPTARLYRLTSSGKS